MQTIHSKQVASISELKKHPSKLISESEGKPVAILNHNVAAAYLIPAQTYEKLLDLLDEKELETLISNRLNDDKNPVKVDLDEL